MQSAAYSPVDHDATNAGRDATRRIDTLTDDAARSPEARARRFASTVAGVVRRGIAKAAGLVARGARAIVATVRAFVRAHSLAVLAFVLMLALGVGWLVMR